MSETTTKKTTYVTDEQYATLKRLHKQVNPQWNTQHVYVLAHVDGDPTRADQVIRDFEAYLKGGN